MWIQGKIPGNERLSELRRVKNRCRKFRKRKIHLLNPPILLFHLHHLRCGERGYFLATELQFYILFSRYRHWGILLIICFCKFLFQVAATLAAIAFYFLLQTEGLRDAFLIDFEGNIHPNLAC